MTSDGSPGYKPPDLVRALSDAVKSINSGASVEDVLEQIVKSSRQILDARYGAAAILRPDSTIAQFVVDGLEPDEIEKIGDLPRGRGMLGAVIESGAAIRSPDISRDPRRSGFPPGHPTMKSFLSVPIRVDGQIVGTLYLSDKQSAESFSSEDEWIAGVLAEHAGIAVHKARWLTARETFISIAVNEPDEGRPAITRGWYREIISALLDSGSCVWFAKLVAIGELTVGIALILGAFMAITAAAGAFMNLNFIMAGSASTNGLLLLVAVVLLVGWRVSGYLGFDGLVMARIPMPWNRPAEDPEVSRETVEAPT